MEEYFLRSTRLGFRTWHSTDQNLAFELWGDPEVTGLIGGPFTSEQVQARMMKEIRNANAFGVQYWPFFLLQTDEYIGCCGLRPYKVEEHIYEIGFHLRRVFWGRGYAGEAASTVIQYAFNNLNADALFAGHNPNNSASRHVLEKLGFCYTHDEYYPPTGLRHPSYILRRDASIPQSRNG